jgi:hypothetical protein
MRVQKYDFFFNQQRKKCIILYHLSLFH